jgi:hypothetical protein
MSGSAPCSLVLGPMGLRASLRAAACARHGEDRRWSAV